MKKIIALFVSAFVSVGVFAQWDTLTTNSTINFNAVYFSNDTHGVAVGKNTSGRGDSYFSIDGGQTWTQGTRYFNTKSYNDLAFVSLYLAWAVTDSGCVLQSNDEGHTWYFSSQPTTSNLNCICNANDTVFFAGGDNGVLFRSPDWGISWDTLSSGTNLAINDIYFIDANNGWIVGDGGYMAATADGGQTWFVVSQPLFGFFNCNGIAYAGETSDAYAVGNFGDMLHSPDGGFSWYANSTNTSYNLNSVQFTNDLAGIICGDNGIIFRTIDGGGTWWNESMTNVTEDLTGISWASDTLAFICGSNGRILKSHTDISSVHSVLENNFEISAYPNPFETDLNIIINLKKNSLVSFSIIDLAGRVLFEEDAGELNSGKHILRPDGISNLMSGMYFVKVISGESELVIPVVKN